MSLIQPRTLKGFRDYPPELMMPREWLIDVARRVYRSYGFVPIDTPALEFYEILAGKGGDESDRQIYQFRDHGERHVAMRFDLTVPLARFAAQHSAELALPFKRYHIGPVWRGENPQAGRYREFLQCDFDTVGTTSVLADIETVLVVHDLMSAIGFTDFVIRVNHRKVLSGLLEHLGLTAQATTVLRSIDKLDKIGPDAVAEELQRTAATTSDQVAVLLEFVQTRGTNDEVLGHLQKMLGHQPMAAQGLSDLRQLFEAVAAVGLPEQTVQLDCSIARGLDYYTGMVIETILRQLPDIGSVCSGGRYDNLAGLFTKQALPGIGASLGLDRLLTAMDQLGMLPETKTSADVFVAMFDEKHRADYLRIAAALRRHGWKVLVYPESRKLGQQLKYADRLGFAAAIVMGSAEFESGQAQIKFLRLGSQQTVPWKRGDVDEIHNCLREHFQTNTQLVW